MGPNNAKWSSAAQQNSTEASCTARTPILTHTHTAHTHNKDTQQTGRQAGVPPKTGLGPGLIYGHQSGEQRAAISKKILNGVHTANGGEKERRDSALRGKRCA